MVLQPGFDKLPQNLFVTQYRKRHLKGKVIVFCSILKKKLQKLAFGMAWIVGSETVWTYNALQMYKETLSKQKYQSRP